MKLINVSKRNGRYVVKALNSYKAFGFQFYSTVKAYGISDSKTEWHEIKSGKKVSEEKKIILDRWLKVHQKFIEKT